MAVDKIFRPRRGKQATMESAGTVLKKGEMFFEVPTGGVGTGQCRIKMGDGSSAYSALPYAINLDNCVASGSVSSEKITFTASTSTSNATLLSEISSGATVATLMGSIKTLLTNLNTSVTELNNDYDSISDSLDSCVSTTYYVDSSGGSLDLNDFKTPGVYYISSYYTLSNQPDSSTNGWLWVLNVDVDKTCKQIFYRHGTINSNNFRTYIRNYASSSDTWSSWYKQITTAEMNGGYDLQGASWYAPTSSGTDVTKSLYGAATSNPPQWLSNRASLWSGNLSTIGSMTLSESAYNFEYIALSLYDTTDSAYPAILVRPICPILSTTTSPTFYGFKCTESSYSSNSTNMTFFSFASELSSNGLTITLTNKIIGVINFSTGNISQTSRSNIGVSGVVGYR